MEALPENTSREHDERGVFFQVVNRIGLDLIVEKVRAFCQFDTPRSRPDASYLTPPMPASSTLTVSQNTSSRQLLQHRPTTSDPSRLAPEDAFYAHSPPRRVRQHSPLGLGASDGSSVRALTDPRRKRDKERGRSGSRRKKGQWKKLLWFKQPCTLCVSHYH